MVQTDYIVASSITLVWTASLCQYAQLFGPVRSLIGFIWCWPGTTSASLNCNGITTFKKTVSYAGMESCLFLETGLQTHTRTITCGPSELWRLPFFVQYLLSMAKLCSCCYGLKLKDGAKLSPLFLVVLTWMQQNTRRPIRSLLGK